MALFSTIGNMIYKAGAGPEPIPSKELTMKKLRDAIKVAISPGAKEAAKSLGDKIREEVSGLEFTVSVSQATLPDRTEWQEVSRASTSTSRC